MKFLVCLTLMAAALVRTEAAPPKLAFVKMAKTTAKPECDASFVLQDDGRLARRTSKPGCMITWCDPSTGDRYGLGCPLHAVPMMTVEGNNKLAEEGCYNAFVTDENAVYPGCCPKYKKVCKGNPKFDENRVPKKQPVMCMKPCGTDDDGTKTFCPEEC